MIRGWVEGRFRDSDAAAAVKKKFAESQLLERERRETPSKMQMTLFGAEPEPESESESEVAPYTVGDAKPGAFFAFTSNVDAHHFDWFEACEIRECHGNTELYQCAASNPCSDKVWRAPLDFRFHVDKQTMLAPAVAPT